ncbi:MAG: hypothetical protein JRC99_13265, partial [Deltaproteobacteria bacterium]|nr:hypothetical protein [Deltaproteobacteria bacterium]
MREASIYFWITAILLYLFAANPTHAEDVIISGESFFLVIDVDGDGPDEVEDCRWLVTNSGSTYTVTPVQAPPTSLRACTGTFSLVSAGSGQDESSDWEEFIKDSSGVEASGGEVGFPALRSFVSEPYEIEIIDESGAPDGPPLNVNWIRFEDPPGQDRVRSEVFFCDNDGPVVAVEVLADLLVVHLPFIPYPNAQSPNFYTLKSLPFELAPPNAGTIVNHDVYLPVTDDGHFTVANAGSPDDLFIDIDFKNPTDCSKLINLQPPDPEFLINTAISDAWFYPATSGQGFFIIVWEDQKLVFMAWFTYDTERPPEDVTAVLGEPGHRWLTALGPYEGDTAVLDTFLSSGMIFDSAEPPVTTEQLGGATIEIVWTDCNNGLVKYNIP